jgi:hypothetical protein
MKACMPKPLKNKNKCNSGLTRFLLYKNALQKILHCFNPKTYYQNMFPHNKTSKKNFSTHTRPKKTFKIPPIIITITLLHFITFSTFSILRLYSLKTHMNDLGNMEQAIYNTTKGRFMFTSNIPKEGDTTGNRLGGHANFILLLIVPIYKIFPTPQPY